jgi:hypothetical protein
MYIAHREGAIVDKVKSRIEGVELWLDRIGVHEINFRFVIEVIP